MRGVRATTTGLLVLAIGIAWGCGKQAGEGNTAGRSGTRIPPQAEAQPPETEAAPDEAAEAKYAYDPIGKRDPFRSFVLERLREDAADDSKGPLEQFELSQIALLGVVWETNNARALVADPSGHGYIVRHGDKIGKNDGRVIRIDDNLVLVRETYVDYVGETTSKDIEMRVRQGLGG